MAASLSSTSIPPGAYRGPFRAPARGDLLIPVPPALPSFVPPPDAGEVLVLPDRRDLLDPFDRVAARGERLGPVRRRGRDRDARLADLDPADAVVDREPRRGPALRRFAPDPLERLQRQGPIGLIV